MFQTPKNGNNSHGGSNDIMTLGGVRHGSLIVIVVIIIVIVVFVVIVFIIVVIVFVLIVTVSSVVRDQTFFSIGQELQSRNRLGGGPGGQSIALDSNEIHQGIPIHGGGRDLFLDLNHELIDGTARDGDNGTFLENIGQDLIQDSGQGSNPRLLRKRTGGQSG